MPARAPAAAFFQALTGFACSSYFGRQLGNRHPVAHASSAIFAFNPASCRRRIAWSFCPLLLVMIEQTSTLIPGPFAGLLLAAGGWRLAVSD
jgi:hypothetical protein